MNIATKKTLFSRDIICFVKTYSQHMEILQVEFIPSVVEEEKLMKKKKLKG
jgi:hypothetical protein